MWKSAQLTIQRMVSEFAKLGCRVWPWEVLQPTRGSKGGGSEGPVWQDGWLTDNSFGLDKINEIIKIVYFADNVPSFCSLTPEVKNILYSYTHSSLTWFSVAYNNEMFSKYSTIDSSFILTLSATNIITDHCLNGVVSIRLWVWVQFRRLRSF